MVWLDELQRYLDGEHGLTSAVMRALLNARHPLYRYAADVGGEAAARALDQLLTERGDLEELRARAAAGDGFAALGLAELLGERGDLDEAEQILRARADTGNDFAAWALADLLAGRIGPDESIVTGTPIPAEPPLSIRHPIANSYTGHQITTFRLHSGWNGSESLRGFNL